MKSTPEHTNIRTTKADVKRIDVIHKALKEKGYSVKKYELWSEAVSLLEKKLFKSDGTLR